MVRLPSILFSFDEKDSLATIAVYTLAYTFSHYLTTYRATRLKVNSVSPRLRRRTLKGSIPGPRLDIISSQISSFTTYQEVRGQFRLHFICQILQACDRWTS